MRINKNIDTPIYMEMDSNQSGAVGGIILGVFQGSLTHLGASFEKVLSMAAERGEIPNTLTFLIPRGGQSGTLTFF